MTEKTGNDIIAKVQKAEKEGIRKYPCGVNAANDARIATMMRAKAILERQQNG